MKTVVRRVAPLLLILGLIAAVYVSGLYRYISLEVLRERHQQLRDFVDAHFWTALALYTTSLVRDLRAQRRSAAAPELCEP